jgi:pyruvate formate lyase activating enzyme
MHESNALVVGGVTPFTTIDFPGRLAAVVFCQGCPWRCEYCHNPHLLPRVAEAVDGTPSWQELLQWLEARRGLLGGVVFSGGEPLLQRGLPGAIAAVRRLGFATALHTGGAYPERLQAVLPLLDWVGFDVKAPFDGYARITGADSGRAARQSLELLLSAGVAHEVRCTVDPDLLNADDVARMGKQLHAIGVHRVVLQPCRREGRTVSFPSQVMLGSMATAGVQAELRLS